MRKLFTYPGSDIDNWYLEPETGDMIRVHDGLRFSAFQVNANNVLQFAQGYDQGFDEALADIEGSIKNFKTLGGVGFKSHILARINQIKKDQRIHEV